MSLSETVEPSGIVELAVRRRRGDALEPAVDRVGQEWPVALVFNGISHAVMMCTPRDLEAFAVGFAVSEGIVGRGSDVKDIEVALHGDAPLPYAEVQLTVVQQAFTALKEKRRALAGRTGCGVCGIESIDLLDLVPERVPDAGFLARIAPDAIARAARELPAHQALTRQTGGLHAAAWCDASGAIVHAFEDIGRHNALDKLIGTLTLTRADMTNGFVFLSSRASYELVRKSARVGIPMVATISAPSSLAIEIARQAGLRLVSFCREAGYVDYGTA
ncbi:formate dehydrogenase accessory sulfurtransferase FdhD [Burkholderia thailandensis]|uniref:formate dehydrogenase accessory sulfurtransferase FdhD n=1 Tax=Burkholderia thailandensis TaxID=57975 RepID=UPI0003EC6BC7|nr:formate dehydrogenase accessory sulfurtransferase FdhD [Burkholderia thailandensis]AHI66062.1 formate dehydrogenase family accessory protein FdhD [Burkholderia thailandensis H0587]AOJ51904.1 formate dehydrogenase accessory protein FdhD [Burkholderia thailandensis]AVR24246.1 formate dehydrogenase accessory sulfurtransferase FdhD [Burkholderia thailandensis]MCZ2895768.1 formate dehydrogenase accessory sulfurtransferase FdhD [Burkholderia thailandensis]MCZ2902550.1 formate dehydrogenase access